MAINGLTGISVTGSIEARDANMNLQSFLSNTLPYIYDIMGIMIIMAIAAYSSEFIGSAIYYELSIHAR